MQGMQEQVLESEWTLVLGIQVRAKLVLDEVRTQLLAALLSGDDRGIDRDVFELL